MIELPKNFKNSDLVVKKDCDGSPVEQPGAAQNLVLAKFTDLEKMQDWHYAAYQAYGYERCKEENIDTLGDLFGEEFFQAWQRQMNRLLAKEILHKALEDRAALDDRIRECNAVLDNPPDYFPFNQKPPETENV